jgi:hypothetical protein
MFISNAYFKPRGLTFTHTLYPQHVTFFSHSRYNSYSLEQIIRYLFNMKIMQGCHFAYLSIFLFLCGEGKKIKKKSRMFVSLWHLFCIVIFGRNSIY